VGKLESQVKRVTGLFSGVGFSSRPGHHEANSIEKGVEASAGERGEGEWSLFNL